MAADGSVVIQITGDDKEFKKALGGLGSVASSALKGIAVAASVATVGVIALAKQSITAFASYEQLVGGVETLFKDSAGLVEEYANNAYKTAGISANEYMETVTGFSASLLQSLGGDTEEAAKVADMAITDMADNANKMGTSMDAIQVAYQGFAKQNYTMLDNLKLGYGGTKTEMERLLADAEAFSGVDYDINNLNDVYEAIHVIQSELDITGTTAKEASTTIQGSAASMRAAWGNLLVGLADDTQDFDLLLENMIDSVGVFGENLIPRIEIALGGIAQLAAKLGPQIATMLPSLMSNLLPEITQIAVSIVQSLLAGLSESLPQLAEGAVSIVTMLASSVIDLLPELAIIAVQLISALVSGIASNLPALIPAAIGAIITLVQGLLDNLPNLIGAGIELIVGLIEGLVEAIPMIIAATPQLVEAITNALIANIDKLILAGFALFVALIQNLPAIIEAIITAAPEIVGAIVGAFGSLAGEIVSIGENIVKGVWTGIQNMAKWLTDKVKNFFGGIVSGIKKTLNINSPSVVMAKEIGQPMGQGVAVGFEDEMATLNKKMQAAVNMELAKVSVNAAIQAENNATGSTSTREV